MICANRLIIIWLLAAMPMIAGAGNGAARAYDLRMAETCARYLNHINRVDADTRSIFAAQRSGRDACLDGMARALRPAAPQAGRACPVAIPFQLAALMPAERSLCQTRGPSVPKAMT